MISWGLDSSLERERKIRRRLFTFSITRRFATTTIFSVTQPCNIVATLFRIVTTLFQHCNAVLHFHVAVVQWRQRNVQKAWCTCKVVILLIKPNCFFAVLVAVAVVKALELWLSLLIISKHLLNKRASLKPDVRMHRSSLDVRLGRRLNEFYIHTWCQGTRDKILPQNGFMFTPKVACT